MRTRTTLAIFIVSVTPLGAERSSAADDPAAVLKDLTAVIALQGNRVVRWSRLPSKPTMTTSLHAKTEADIAYSSTPRGEWSCRSSEVVHALHWRSSPRY